MGMQETFDFVFKKLYEQNAVSIGFTGMCAYRGKDGRRCAVGWLIPDELYDPKMEGMVIDYPCVEAAVQGHSMPLLEELQSAHDNIRGDFRASLIRRFRCVAEMFDLSTAVIDAV